MDTLTDPAWFYSSLAQAAASIVGIVGAVFLTRLTDHRARMLEEHRLLADELVQYGATFAKAATDYTDEATLAMQRALRPADRQAVGDGASALRSLAGPVEPTLMAAIEHRLTECEQHAPGGWAKGELHQKAEYLQLLRRKVESFRARALPRTLVAVWALLAWLSVFGVLWPLLALPGLPRRAFSKGLILTGFGIGILGFIGYLAVELWRLRQLGRAFTWTSTED